MKGRQRKMEFVFLWGLSVLSISLALPRSRSFSPRGVFSRIVVCHKGLFKTESQKVRGNRKSSSQKLPLSDPSLPSSYSLSFVSLSFSLPLSLSPHTLSAILYLSRSRERGAEKRPEICS